MILQNLSQLKQRLILGTLTTGIVLIAIYFSIIPWFQPIFVLLFASFLSIGVWEYYQIAKAKGSHPLVRMGIAATMAYAFATYLQAVLKHAQWLPEIVFLTFFLAFFLYYFFRDKNPLINLAITVFGISYIAIPLSLMITITFSPEPNSFDGRVWLLYLLCVTKMTDTGAYFIGKTFGKSKLAAHISPKKTIKGSIGGFLSAILASILFYVIFTIWPNLGQFHLTFFESVILGVLIGIIAQIGDLAESLLKRDGGVSDSNQLPGLGGALDILDSLVFTTPLLYFFLQTR